MLCQCLYAMLSSYLPDAGVFINHVSFPPYQRREDAVPPIFLCVTLSRVWCRSRVLSKVHAVATRLLVLDHLEVVSADAKRPQDTISEL